MLSHWLTSDVDHSALESLWDVVSVLRSDQDACPVESSFLEARFDTLSYCGREDVHHVLRELRNVVRHSDQEPSSSQVIVHFDESLCQDERVNEHQSVAEVERDSSLALPQLSEGLQQDAVGLWIVSELLLLLSHVQCDLSSWSDLVQHDVEFEDVLRWLWAVALLSHEIVNKFMGQSIDFDSSNHVDHGRDVLVSIHDKELQGLGVLLSLIVVNSGLAPELLSLIELSDLEVLFYVPFINSEDDSSILVHLLEGLCDDKSFFTLPSQDEELNGLLLGSLGLAPISDHECALWSLALVPENVLSFLWILQVLKVQPDETLVVIGFLIGAFSLLELLLCFLRLSNHDENSW